MAEPERKAKLPARRSYPMTEPDNHTWLWIIGVFALVVIGVAIYAMAETDAPVVTAPATQSGGNTGTQPAR